jgi:hypothetical protein
MNSKTTNRNQNQDFYLNGKKISIGRAVKADSNGLLLASSTISIKNNKDSKKPLSSNIVDVTNKNIVTKDYSGNLSRFTISSANTQGLKIEPLGVAGQTGLSVQPVSTEQNPNVFLNFWNVNFDRNFLAFNFSSDSFAGLSVGSSFTSWQDEITEQSISGSGEVVEAYGQKFLKITNGSRFYSTQFKLRNVLNPSFGILVFAVATTDSTKTTQEVLSPTRKVLQFLDNVTYEIKTVKSEYVDETLTIPYVDRQDNKMKKFTVTVKKWVQSYKVYVDQWGSPTSWPTNISWQEQTSEKETFIYYNSDKYKKDNPQVKFIGSRPELVSEFDGKYPVRYSGTTNMVDTSLKILISQTSGTDFGKGDYKIFTYGYAYSVEIDQGVTTEKTYTETTSGYVEKIDRTPAYSYNLYQTNFANIQGSSSVNSAHFITSTLNTLRWASRSGGGQTPFIDFQIHQTAGETVNNFSGGIDANTIQFKEDLTNSASNLSFPDTKTDFIVSESSGDVTYKKFKLFFVQMHTDSVQEDVAFVNSSSELLNGIFLTQGGIDPQYKYDARSKAIMKAWEELGYGVEEFYPSSYPVNLNEILTKVQFNTIINGKQADSSYYRLQQAADLYKQDGYLMVAQTDGLGKGNFVDYAVSLGHNDGSVVDSEIFLMDYLYGYEQTKEKRDNRSNLLMEHLVHKYKNLIFKTSDDDFQISNSTNALQFNIPSAHPFIKIHTKGE